MRPELYILFPRSSNSTKSNVKVSKVKDYSIDVTVDGKDITVQLPEDAGGNVTVIVDGKEFTGKVENGTVTINDSNYKNKKVIGKIRTGDLTTSEYTLSINKPYNFLTNFSIASTGFIGINTRRIILTA